LALAKLQTFQGPLLIFEMNSKDTLSVLKFETVSRSAMNSMPAQEPWKQVN